MEHDEGAEIVSAARSGGNNGNNAGGSEGGAGSGPGASGSRPHGASKENPQHIALKAALLQQELEADEGSEYDWRGILISILVISFISSMIILSIYLLSPTDDDPYGLHTRRLSLEQVLSSRFQARLFNGTWISGDEFIDWTDNKDIRLFNAMTRTSKTLVSGRIARQFNAESFKMSWDQRYVLYAHDSEKVTKHTRKNKYTIYDTKSEEHFSVKTSPRLNGEPSKLQAVEWLPRQHSLVIVEANDVYLLREIKYDGRLDRITSTGEDGIIFNGVPDVGMEAIFPQPHTLFLSEGGTKMAFLSANDTLVPVISLQSFLSQTEASIMGDPLLFDAVGNKKARYPKPGHPLPEISITVADLPSSPNQKVKLHSIEAPKEVLLLGEPFPTSLSWVSENHLHVTWTNRDRSRVIMAICSSPSMECRMILQESKSGTYVGAGVAIHGPPVFSIEGSRALVITSKPMYGRRELKLVESSALAPVTVQSSTKSKQSPRRQEHSKTSVVSSPDQDVERIVGWDENRNAIYYFSRALLTGERHLFKLSLKSNNETMEPFCVTCGLNLYKTKLHGSSGKRHWHHCAAYDAIFSPSFAHCVLECKGPDVPVSALFSSVDAVTTSEPEASSLGHALEEPQNDDSRAAESSSRGTKRSRDFLRESMKKNGAEDLLMTADEKYLSTMRLSGNTDDYLDDGVGTENVRPGVTRGRKGSISSTISSTLEGNKPFLQHHSSREFLSDSQKDFPAPDGEINQYIKEVKARRNANPTVVASRHSTPGPASTSTTAWNLTKDDPRFYFPLNDNAGLREETKQFFWPRREIKTVTLKNGVTAPVQLLYPVKSSPLEDDDADKAYPLLLQIGTVPDFETDPNWWQTHWGTSLVSDWEIIYGIIHFEKEIPSSTSSNSSTSSSSNRANAGSGSRTRSWPDSKSFPDVLPMGRINIEDIIEAARQVIETNPLVNKSLVAIWGWGKGGFLALQTLARLPMNLIGCGIAVAPVTSWMDFNAFEAESYWGELNSETRAIYRDMSLEALAPEFRSKELYLLHGTMDTTVPLEQTMLFSKHLIANHAFFHQQIYAGEEHDMRGVRSHLYRSMETFLEDYCHFKRRNPFGGSSRHRKKQWNKFEEFERASNNQ